MSRTFRDRVLALAETQPFARRLVNSGAAVGGDLLRRLGAERPGRVCARRYARHTRPGAAAQDAPLDNGWLFDYLEWGLPGYLVQP